jgi:ABC-type multidrug transport system ATPase subunit
MTLVLAPPGHGKSAYLKALAQLLPQTPALRGDIKYSGYTRSEALEQGIHLNNLVQYVEQLDQHLPFLSVRETFNFLHENALVNPADHGHPELEAAHLDRVNDTIRFLHLENCADTMVGDALLRGVSGGEKKRVTVGEGLLTNARVMLLEYVLVGCQWMCVAFTH